MHAPIEGVYRTTEKIEDRVAIGEKRNQNHDENTPRTYLERIRGSMQKPIEGRSRTTPHGALNKGGIVCASTKALLNQHAFISEY
jgi:hypothetical protein